MRRIGLPGLLLAATGLAGCGLSGGGGPTPEIDAAGEPATAVSRTPLDDVRAARGQSPAEPYWPYREAVLLAETDSLEAAERCLREAIALDPGYAPALTLLSSTYFEAGRHDEAIALMERALASGRLMPPELYESLALQYDAAGRYDESEAALERATPSPRGSSVPAYLHLRGEEPAAAVASAEAAVDTDSRSAVHRNNLGIARMRSGDPVRAREELLTAHDLDPSLPGPLYNLALIERHFFSDVAAARTWFARYWALSREDPDSLRNDLFPGEPVPSLQRSEHP